MTRNFGLGPGSHEPRYSVIVKLILLQTQFFHHLKKISSASACLQHHIYKLIFYWGRDMYLNSKKIIATYTTNTQDLRKDITKWNDLMILKPYMPPTRVAT